MLAKRGKQNDARAEMRARREVPRLRSMTFTERPVLLETHWTRILHQDLFDAPARAAAQPARKETRMAPTDTQRHDPDLARSPLGSAMILLGIYIAMYLAVAEVVHVLAPADASTVASRADQAAMSSAPTMPAASGATGSNHATTD